MVAGGLPTIQVLLDDGTGTFPYDISSFVRLREGYTCKRGRQDELSAPTAGDCALWFDNTDGRFTVGSTIIASPSPIKADARVRVKVTANAVTVNRFTQHVQNWPVEWPDGSDLFSIAAITGTDVQAKAERRILRSVIEEEIALDSPSAVYTLGEPAGATTAADSSGNSVSSLTQVGTGTAVVFGSGVGPTTDGLTAATLAGGAYLQLAGLTVAPAGQGVYFATTTTPAQPMTIMTNAAGNAICVHTDGKVRTLAGDLTSPVVTDGLVHHLLWETGHVYLDGADIGSPSSGLGGAGTVLLGGGGVFGAGTATTPFVGTLAHFAVFASAPSAARALAQYQAGSTGFAGESGAARITRLAGYANLPIGTLDTSLTNVAFVDFAGTADGQALRDVADAEFGLVYFDGSGNLTFHNRNRAVNKTTPDVTIDANFLAEGTRFEYDMQGVLNYLEVTAAGTGLAQVVRNVTSEVTNAHGRYGDSRTYLVQTDREALDRGNWIISTHAEPAARIGSLVVDVLTMTAVQQAAMLTLEPDSWLRVTGLPGQTPGGTTADFVVQGFAEALNVGEWTMTLNAANRAVAAPTPLILDNATYGVLDSNRLFV